MTAGREEERRGEEKRDREEGRGEVRREIKYKEYKTDTKRSYDQIDRNLFASFPGAGSNS